MISRRVFAGCGLCAAMGLVATGVSAQGGPTFTRTVLDKAEIGGTVYDTILIAVDIDPQAKIARHTHPGTESGALVDGEIVLSIAGKPDRTLKPGDGYFVPHETAHSIVNADRKARVVATFVVDRTKPLASPA